MEMRCFQEKFTVGNIFTQSPVVTVATNFKSAPITTLYNSRLVLMVFHGSMSVFIGFQGLRLVFHVSRSVFMVFQGLRLVFRGSRLVFNGF